MLEDFRFHIIFGFMQYEQPDYDEHRRETKERHFKAVCDVLFVLCQCRSRLQVACLRTTEELLTYSFLAGPCQQHNVHTFAAVRVDYFKFYLTQVPLFVSCIVGK